MHSVTAVLSWYAMQLTMQIFTTVSTARSPLHIEASGLLPKKQWVYWVNPPKNPAKKNAPQ